MGMVHDGKVSADAGWIAHKMNSAFESERNRLLSQIHKDKRCIRCSTTYKQFRNHPQACSSHPGTLKYFSCSGCGGEKYFSCCGKCENCNPGCSKTPHASYE
eukprot:GDKK01008237.1.p1 GENE.GDKK01008237.1~~GDKK01008237.1.p1  ORF type:complete len:102 (-),score=10.47 GDKK01008237.1:80-385(-)